MYIRYDHKDSNRLPRDDGADLSRHPSRSGFVLVMMMGALVGLSLVLAIVVVVYTQYRRRRLELLLVMSHSSISRVICYISRKLDRVCMYVCVQR